jgi:hypothetical protein
MRASLLWAGPSSVSKRTGLNLEELGRGGLKRTDLFKPSNVFKVAARGWDFDFFAASRKNSPLFRYFFALSYRLTKKQGNRITPKVRFEPLGEKE